MNLAVARTDAVFELVDLRDYPMPFFDEPKSPLREPAKHPAAQRWSAKVASLDGFIFVTPEYNHSITAVLKNAIDHLYPEFNRKPAGYVAYGNAGGARAVEQLRQILVEVQVAPIRAAVHIDRHAFVGMLLEGKSFDEFPHLAQQAHTMLDDLVWWARTLRAGRQG